jgi:prepilin signal peptidase PulO-like enzyme (type II secretory pathway)
MSVLVFLGIAALLMLCDYKHRAVPRALPILGTILGAYLTGFSAVTITAGIALGCGIAFVADLPLGDMAVGGMLGAWFGWEGTLLLWLIALGLGNIVWLLWEDRFIDWPGEWPFTPLLLVPACVIVLAQGGW